MPRLRLALLLTATLALAWLYRTYEPGIISFYPECPILAVTGYQCPGCGTQRAAHDLLHFDWAGAWGHNPLVLVLVPYVLLVVGLELMRPQAGVWARVHRGLLSTPALLVALAVLIVFGVGRNVW